MLKDLNETHLGLIKMKILARERVWWRNIEKSIEDVSNRCSLCNLSAAREPLKRYLTSWPSCNQTWTRVHVDFTGPFLKPNLFASSQCLFGLGRSYTYELYDINCSSKAVKAIDL